MKSDIESIIQDLYNRIEEEVSYRSFSSQMIETLEKTRSDIAEELTVEPTIDLLSKTLSKAAKDYSTRVIFEEVGTVQNIGNGIANLTGLPRVGVNELVEFPTKTQGLVLNLEADTIDVIMLGEEEGIHGGDLVTSERERIRIPVGPDVIGRIISPLGDPLDDQPPIQAVDRRFIEREAPGIIERAPVDEPLHTGIKIIDALYPIGRGQRELILGDRQTGKTTLAIDAILNQSRANVTCIYVSIGQKKTSLVSTIETLRNWGAMEYTAVISANPDDTPAMRYLAPFAGCTIAEFFLHQGQDVLIVYDDLSKHADSYRELSLLLRRPPGREAYPGDIFYLHARLMERACKLNKENGGGSLTALPIITMQQGNISAYIPTNLISICDGQIVLSREKFNRGDKPAVDIGMSVSRVGGKAQSEVMQSVSNELKLDLSQYEEVERFTRFGTEVDESTRQQIRRGQRLREILNQPPNNPMSLAQQVVVLNAAVQGFLDNISMEKIRDYENKMIDWFQENHASIMRDINRDQTLDEEREEELKQYLYQFNEDWMSGEAHE